jgi:aminoglycoside phosphotransferase
MASRPKDAEASARLEALYHWDLYYSGEDPRLPKARALVTFCGDACSPNVLARIWLTIGVMIISFQGSEADARAAFSRALDIDAAAELDQQLATPRAAQLFDEERARRATKAKP